MTSFTPNDQIRILSTDGHKATIERSVKEVRDSEGMTYGGYGHFVLEDVPLWDYLTRDEKRECKQAAQLRRKGYLAELHAKYRTINLDRVIQKIHARAMAEGREYRKTRYGMKYDTPTGFARQSASAEAVKR